MDEIMLEFESVVEGCSILDSSKSSEPTCCVFSVSMIHFLFMMSELGLPETTRLWGTVVGLRGGDRLAVMDVASTTQGLEQKLKSPLRHPNVGTWSRLGPDSRGRMELCALIEPVKTWGLRDDSLHESLAARQRMPQEPCSKHSGQL